MEKGGRRRAARSLTGVFLIQAAPDQTRYVLFSILVLDWSYIVGVSVIVCW